MQGSNSHSTHYEKRRTNVYHVRTKDDKMPPTHPGARCAKIKHGVGFILSHPIQIRVIGVKMISSQPKKLHAFLTSASYEVCSVFHLTCPLWIPSSVSFSESILKAVISFFTIGPLCISGWKLNIDKTSSEVGRVCLLQGNMQTSIRPVPSLHQAPMKWP